jgi:hypothetical protein
MDEMIIKIQLNDRGFPGARYVASSGVEFPITPQMHDYVVKMERCIEPRGGLLYEPRNHIAP